ncbi:dTDP-4-dehydrorhamnose reductase [Pectobacterium parmentieri]|uniref:dTDP-4-dehydrorhamnose reductase n=1 Tax=Pectobacterium parmentieri TaxID=1905730 RepID=A0A0H3I777_PECPM|nr:dTDP-4-dehydrorhamnose reductase [Pectobacterium parmentieri]ACX88764.1 dTDP-4-dehydrorhamnose reductase [Pectobacterium parmentieri WPP163]AFI91086.1 dTDP-4-dehydrorhamnose reductase [Pectobacterium parmentieri]AYH02178.1 dTDP-4-dehydrorhamnose reductase [Pectobacterium parmentieri]AYH10997.1 dTDP-4-dehydrorhamnose reductase [Pectobacterium parmentieri]AYH18288.1 dTDP-4-dehydrorhamnose reductase [Pectobacterium parmentieri]
MKILLTGAKGQLGRCFQDRLPIGWEILATDAAELDITDLACVEQVVQDFQPNAIVNAAAYTAVDKAESEPELAERINVIGPMNLAIAANKQGTRLIHVSTDYVFDGNATEPYNEDSATNPLSVYGKTKLAGEQAVAQTVPNSIIVRTAWVFSEYGNNFVKTMLRLAKERDTLSIVNDQRGCPTYAGDLAQAIISLLEKNTEGGIYHYCGDREVSWYEFAESIFAIAADKSLLIDIPSLKAISTTDYPTPAYRPAFSTLSCDKVKKLGISLSGWEKALQKTI